MLGQDVALLLKLCLLSGPRILSKTLAGELYLSPAEISMSLRRCSDSGLLHYSDLEKRVNRPALLEFLVHGLRYVFPAEQGGLVRGLPTAAAASPLKEHLIDHGEPPPVWQYAEGHVRGISFKPLYKSAPQAALADAKFYELLALSDAIRGGRTREQSMAADYLRKALNV